MERGRWVWVEGVGALRARGEETRCRRWRVGVVMRRQTGLERGRVIAKGALCIEMVGT